MNRPDLYACASVDVLIADAAHLVAGAIRRSVSERGRCRLALAGGNTPGPLYRALADPEKVGPLPFDKVEVLFGDERAVALDHPDSNYFMARSSFLDAVPAFSAVRAMAADADDIDAAAQDYARYLSEPIDVLLLGMGPDAHIASIFPDSKVFDHPRLLAMAIEGPKPPPRRITITPATIQMARRVFVLATGASKEAAIRRVFTEPFNPVKLPAQLVRHATWLVDQPAAAGFSGSHQGVHQ